MTFSIDGRMSNAIKQELVEQRKIKEKIIIFLIMSIFGLLLFVVSALLCAIFLGIISCIFIFLVFVGIVLFTCFFGSFLKARTALSQSENRFRVLSQYNEIRQTTGLDIARFENKLPELISRFEKERGVSKIAFCDKYYRHIDNMKRTLSLETIDLNPENLSCYKALSRNIFLGIQDLELSFNEEMQKLRILLEEIFCNDSVLTFSKNRLDRSLCMNGISETFFNPSVKFFEKIKETCSAIQAGILDRSELSDEVTRSYLKTIAELRQEIEEHAVGGIAKFLRLEDILQGRSLNEVLTNVQSQLEATLKELLAERVSFMKKVEFFQGNIPDIKIRNDALGSLIRNQSLLMEQRGTIDHGNMRVIDFQRHIETELMKCRIMKLKKQSELDVLESYLSYLERAYDLPLEQSVIFWQKNEKECTEDQSFLIKESSMIYPSVFEFMSSYLKYVAEDRFSMEDSSDTLVSLITAGGLLCSNLGIEEFEFSLDEESLMLIYRKIFNKLSEISSRCRRSDKLLFGIEDVSESVRQVMSLPIHFEEEDCQYHARISKELKRYYCEKKMIFLTQSEIIKTELLSLYKTETAISSEKSRLGTTFVETDSVFETSKRLIYPDSLHIINLELLGNLRYIMIKRIEQMVIDLSVIHSKNQTNISKELSEVVLPVLSILQKLIVGEIGDFDQQLMFIGIERIIEDFGLIDSQFQEIHHLLNRFKQWLFDWKISNV
ncbi:MAG: hypothetical protein RR599_00520 [Victivallaceae bacterium]